MEAIVRAENLTRRFDGLTAVDRLNVEVAEGEVFGIVGPDGAGKTTTLRMLSGLLDPSEGKAVIGGRDPVRDPDAVRDQIGYMAQRFGLYSDLTVQENMNFYADLFGIAPSERGGLSDQLLRMTRMDPFRSRPAGKLSGGMKQKLALMCTLLHHPRILLLDEPTNGVDPVSRRDFWVILSQLVSEGLTVIVTTAYLEEAERCTRVGLMHKGRLIRCDAPQAIRAGIQEACYSVRAPNVRAVRDVIKLQPGVVSAEPAGAALHVFLDPAATSADKLRVVVGAVEFERIEPTLEDVFVLLIGKEAVRA